MFSYRQITFRQPLFFSTDRSEVKSATNPRSSSNRTLAVPRTRTILGDRSFAVAGPRVWTSLSATVGQITSYGQFRQHLKTHLFEA